MSYFFNFNFILWNDVPEPWQILFQDSATNIMESIDRLNGSVYYYETILLVITGWILISILSKFTKNELRYKYHNHGTNVPLKKFLKLNNSKNYIAIRIYFTLSSNSLDINNITYIKKYENAYKMKKDIFKENKG